MDPFLKLIASLAPLFLLFLPLLAGCASERLAAREVLADPLMRFHPGRPVRAPGEPVVRDHLPLPTDTVQMQVRAEADPGEQVAATWLTSSVRTAVELAAGFGLEAGYGLELERERLYGFAGPLDFERLRHGPDAALVYDDGTSVLRAGYRYRTAFDGDLHEPSVAARTLILGSDTRVELGYRRTMAAIHVDADSEQEVDDDRSADRIHAAVEQGFLPGVNLRLEVAGLLESGYLQNPYRLEQHPDSRARWGALL